MINLLAPLLSAIFIIQFVFIYLLFAFATVILFCFRLSIPFLFSFNFRTSDLPAFNLFCYWEIGLTFSIYLFIEFAAVYWWCLSVCVFSVLIYILTMFFPLSFQLYISMLDANKTIILNNVFLSIYLFCFVCTTNSICFFVSCIFAPFKPRTQTHTLQLSIRFCLLSTKLNRNHLFHTYCIYAKYVKKTQNKWVFWPNDAMVE